MPIPLKHALAAAALAFPLFAAAPAGAETVLVSNEKDNTITVLDGGSLRVLRTVPVGERGTYLAFTHDDTAGMRHLRRLADAGLNTVHLLPAFDIATIEERRSAQPFRGRMPAGSPMAKPRLSANSAGAS